MDSTGPFWPDEDGGVTVSSLAEHPATSATASNQSQHDLVVRGTNEVEKSLFWSLFMFRQPYQPHGESVHAVAQQLTLGGRPSQAIADRTFDAPLRRPGLFLKAVGLPSSLCLE